LRTFPKEEVAGHMISFIGDLRIFPKEEVWSSRDHTYIYSKAYIYILETQHVAIHGLEFEGHMEYIGHVAAWLMSCHNIR
jgi:hypothetical protein